MSAPPGVSITVRRGATGVSPFMVSASRPSSGPLALGAAPAGTGWLVRKVAAIRDALPRGQTLPDKAWAVRHRALLIVLWAHVLGLPVFALCRGHGLLASIGPVAPIAAAGVAGGLKAAGRRARSVAVVFGLLTSSAVLVHAWDGQIEAHFHFFVTIAVLAMYEDWLPFSVAVAYVVGEHGVLGGISPHSVYSHGGNPWLWAGVHGLFVLTAAAAAICTWRVNEDMRARMGKSRRDAIETSEHFRIAFDSGLSGMSLVGADGHFIRVNSALCDITGYTEQELLARTFQSLTHPDDLAKDLDQLGALVDGTVDVYETEKRYVHRDGHEIWVKIGVTAVRDAEGGIRYFITQTHDVTTRRQFENELAHRALHDPLTSLPNRALFLDRVVHALVRQRRHSGAIAILFVDLDRFKLVNDGMGHAVGDVVLLEAGRRLCEAARAEDTVARFGGDEFTILCEDADGDDARRVAERILAAFDRPFEHEGREFHVSASIGVRVNEGATASPDSLLREADIALYAAKEHGSARFEVFDAAGVTDDVDRLATEQALRLALRNGELRLHYQPEIGLESRRIVAVEALVRWQHPERGLLAPGDFIPVAEESGLIVPLGEWVLREACAQLAAWQLAGVVGDDVRVAVNVSARQLSLPDLPQTVAAALASAGLDPGALCLEITESAIIKDSKVALANLEAIKEQGVFLALDDFGVGFSSLSQIRELPPVDVIKVDRSFTAGLGRNNSDGAVVTAVLSLARSLGLTAVAEGVETEGQLELLNGLGCDVAQGFYFARPLPPGEVERLLAADGPPLAAADPHAERAHA
jgi:diguanylate cyclase (GGDEF)-like protein/PAS domain S-box-containing protein